MKTIQRTLILTAISAATLLLTTPSIWAGEGHDHGDAPAAANISGPKRLPDGNVFLPKPAQHQMLVRTIAIEPAQLPRSTELTGKVIMDASAGGKVQPIQSGRIETYGAGLPNLGQAVKKGQVLAYVVSSATALERSSQASQIAELKANQQTIEKRVQRLNALSDTVPRKDIEAAQGELVSIQERLKALSVGLSAKEALIAPISGVIATSNAVAGQVVDARDVVFEIIDTSQLRIEALAYDTQLLGNIASASVMLNDVPVPLAFVGTARALKEQALPIHFRAQNAGLKNFAIGQTLTITVQQKKMLTGFALPNSSIVKNQSNQAAVWVKTAPERFEVRTVLTEPLDAARAVVLSGLVAGDRVVVQAANLISQVR
jgi:membrane fusion protein, heavy metal efflux system